MRVMLGVSGGVAAYKAAELVRVLQRGGAEVQVAMTRGAMDFIQPLTFAALTGKRVLGPEVQAEVAGEEFAIEHVTLGQAVDVLVVAPASANVLARMAGGFADDFVGAFYLAAKVPVVVAPAMNVNMWEHPAVRANVAVLEGRGVRVVLPGAGYLACGMVGGGRLAELEEIAAEVFRVGAGRQDLRGEHVLVTAGGTREAIDPVRFLGNRSSGKMGHALAEEAAARGARVTLVTASGLGGAGCEVVRVTSAAEMMEAVIGRLDGATVVIGAAAVADFRVRERSEVKLRRTGGMVMELEATEDIVAACARRRGPGTVVIAFAAELGDLERAGQEKLRRKGVDAVVVNDVSGAGMGFDGDRNAGLFVTEGEAVELGESTKRVMAGRILDRVVGLRVRVSSGV